MPFTISHAAAALPLQKLTRSRIPLAAMMIGSMAPDFGYFLPLGVDRDEMHSLPGIFRLCLPFGLLAWLFFVRVLERPTIEVLPSPWRERVPRSDAITLKLLVLAALGVVLGAMTHIAWDAFTHTNTPLDSIAPVTYTELFEFRGRTIRVYAVLQYLSSILGLLALAWWGWSLRKAPVATASPPAYEFLTDRMRILAALAVFGAAGGVALLTFVATWSEPFEDRVFYLLTHGMTAGLVAWCVVALLIKATAIRQATSTDGV